MQDYGRVGDHLLVANAYAPGVTNQSEQRMTKEALQSKEELLVESEPNRSG